MIFKGIEVLFFMLGILSTIGTFSVVYYYKKIHFSIPVLLTICLGVFLLVFSVAWSVSSMLEGEPRAASMGMVVFGIPSLILIVLGRRLALKPSKKSK